ncbi:enoyl-CoA hydratase/isomerase family protein [Granulicella arctica]|uniref:enoyl-CoA hydratase/isomerase family protein n=1 Tax=Granulicella arctica TaxID=940613 RepID=UPI0021DF430B|nr:enoyl-CoA hydratase-related protein [Granulicella arctica]
MTDYATILVTERDEVCRITLNRPDRRNAMTPEMQAELIEAMRAAGESACRVVVFTGAGEAFCAGLDLSSLQAMKDKTAEEHREDAERIALLFRTLYELPKPTIAAVHGAAVAGGTGIATLCDFTLAVPAAKFGYTEVRIGFVPAVVSAYLTLQIGDKRARDLLLTGRLFEAEEAQRLGLVTEVVEAEKLMARVQEVATVLKAHSPESLAATKRLLAAQNKLWLDQALDAALTTQAKARGTYDYQEGIAAFLEKRKPIWKS